MPGPGTRGRALVWGGSAVAGAGVIGAAVVWAPGAVASWTGGVLAAAAMAYLSQDVPRQIGAAVTRRRARRESETSTPFTVGVRIRNQDYVVLAEGEDRVVDVPASGHSVRLVVTGAEDLPVVLTELRAEVISRRDRSGELTRHAAEVPVRRFEVLLDERPPRVRALTTSDFPYQVRRDEPEVIDLLVRTESGDVRWVLWLDWTCGARSGSTRVDLGGQAFRTAARYPRPAA
jgi:hypothetical protein